MKVKGGGWKKKTDIEGYSGNRERQEGHSETTQESEAGARWINGGVLEAKEKLQSEKDW